MSNCSITEEGVKELLDSVKGPVCKLKLRFLGPDADEACQYVERVVGKNPLLLRELNLSGSKLEDSNVKKLAALLQDKHCKLNRLKFLKSPAAEQACDYLTEVLGKSPLLLTELDMSEDKLGDLDGEKLSALLIDSHSKVEKIKLNNCRLTDNSCSVLATVLSSKTILKEMNLNNSRLLDSGVKEICERLKNPVCELKILKLCKCELTEESCSALASVLSSDSSSLRDLDLSNNNLQDLRVKLLSDGLKENCKLEKLKLSNCSITEEGYKALASALRSNPSHLIELDLRGNDPGQSGVKEFSDLLQDPNCF
ncbi:ribonuclease inhibitor-like [Carassius auratus]|uniref:Ribonuclease inhibitor-like n=1 Tax=Carassius auratus TaxID=7957 RepID=A0A6P6NQI9_CARAU|nr:ribonuclease inhibitor-like [Carassius auratus]